MLRHRQAIRAGRTGQNGVRSDNTRLAVLVRTSGVQLHPLQMVILFHQLRADVSENDIGSFYFLCSGSFDGRIVKLTACADFFDISLMCVMEWHSN